MTAQQLAKAIPFVGLEKKEVPILIRPKRPEGKPEKTYEYPPTYTLTIQMLGRLEKDGKVVKNKEVSARENKVNVNASFIWSVKSSAVDEERFSKDKRIPIDSDNRDHELDCADFLIALLSGLYPDNHRLCHWDYSWSSDELKDLQITDTYKMYYDRRFVLDLSEAGDSSDKRIHFLEVDRGTKDLGSVKEQFRRYRRFFEDIGRHDEMLLVTAQRYRFKTDEDRRAELVKLLADLKFGKRAAVALQRDAKVNPLSKIWMRVDDPGRLMTLADL